MKSVSIYNKYSILQYEIYNKWKSRKWIGRCFKYLFPCISIIIAKLLSVWFKLIRKSTLHVLIREKKAPISREADRSISKTDMSTVFRLFLGYRVEKKVTTRNSPANPLADPLPTGDSTDIAVALQTHNRTVERERICSEKKFAGK